MMHLSGNQITLDLAGQNTKPTVADGKALQEQISQMLRLLPAEDRVLAEQVLIAGQRQCVAAERLKIPPGTAARRLVRLRNLFASPMHRAVAVNLHKLSDDVRRQAVEFFFLRYSVRLMAEQRGVGRNVMQRQIDYLRGWARAQQRALAMQTTVPPIDDGSPPGP